MGNRKFHVLPLFDIVPNLQASMLDTSQLQSLCEEQQLLTIARVSKWLRSNACIYALDYETAISKEIDSLADELEFFVSNMENAKTENNLMGINNNENEDSKG